MSDRKRAMTAFVLDLLAVLVFVVVGRRNHDESGNVISGAIAVAAPFLIALCVGWLVTRAPRAPFALRTGVGVWLCTVVIGLILRRFAFDRGTATAFIIVATITLGVLLVAWRAIANRLGPRDTPRGVTE